MIAVLMFYYAHMDGVVFIVLLVIFCDQLTLRPPPPSHLLSLLFYLHSRFSVIYTTLSKFSVKIIFKKFTCLIEMYALR